MASTGGFEPDDKLTLFARGVTSFKPSTTAGEVGVSIVSSWGDPAVLRFLGVSVLPGTTSGVRGGVTGKGTGSGGGVEDRAGELLLTGEALLGDPDDVTGEASCAVS